MVFICVFSLLYLGLLVLENQGFQGWIQKKMKPWAGPDSGLIASVKIKERRATSLAPGLILRYLYSLL
jgi:hypothetical protein